MARGKKAEHRSLAEPEQCFSGPSGINYGKFLLFFFIFCWLALTPWHLGGHSLGFCWLEAELFLQGSQGYAWKGNREQRNQALRSGESSGEGNRCAKGVLKILRKNKQTNEQTHKTNRRPQPIQKQPPNVLLYAFIK